MRFARGKEEPAWWSSLPPSLLSPSFTRRTVDQILERRARSPIKAVLLQQDSFPGVGNWMADEILWRAGIHPARGRATQRARARALRREVRFVRGALRSVGRYMAAIRLAGGSSRSAGLARHLSAHRRHAGPRDDQRAHHLLVPALQFRL
ncbi:MAG: hypothetical protein U0527_15545 [Candidatus Eisenbacteria bacterium]